MTELYVLIMAGGRGTRFWPRSRAAMPKQCLSIDGGPTLIQRTVERLAPLAPPERILVITAAEMAPAIREQLPALPAENVLVEPAGRNTAPCVGWGAIEVGRRGGQVMAVLPADHLIEDEAGLIDTLRACAEAAVETGALVTIGLEPTRPETGFGYLELGEAAGDFGGVGFKRVARFVEKPDRPTAERYLAGGRHLWNAGMFIFEIGAIRDAFAEHLPATWAQLLALEAAPGRVEELYPQMEKISIDYGIMERAAAVITAPARVGWSDVGSWAALWDHLPENELGRALIQEGISIDASGCIVYAPDKLVALVGVQDLVVVDSGDALLICPRDEAQRVRDVLAALESRGRREYL